MNVELFKQALEKVVNPNILVNLISKRVRQLNSTGNVSRPLVPETDNMGAIDIALREIAEGKLTYEAPLSTEVLVGATGGKKRRKS